jgi:methionyl-tRNA formyltransferase
LIRQTQPNIIISVQHQWVLPAEIISSVSQAFNLHLAPLPAYKGYNCFNHAILNRESRYGVTLHHLIAEVDAGPIAYAQSFDVAAKETAKSLYEKSVASGLEIFGQLVRALITGEQIPSILPVGREGFYSRTSLDAFREVPADATAQERDIRTRAFHFPPFPGAYVLNGNSKSFLKPR